MPSVTPSYTSSKSNKSSKSSGPASLSRSPSGREKPITAPPLKTSDSKQERSQSSKSSPNSPQQPELPADTLKTIISSKARRSRCGPEFLEEVARGGAFDVFENLGKKFKIITGSEAVGFYKKFIKGTNIDDNVADAVKGASPAVVFAVTVYDAGRKLVDYYMTWKGKTRVHDLKGKLTDSERRSDFLDKDFRKVARSLDKEFKRASIYGSSVGSAAESIKSSLKIDIPETTKIKPPSIIISPSDEKIKSPPEQPPIPASATDSVMSLPFLNMIRGVPLGNRLPLRVTNPDRLSMISSIGSIQHLSIENKVPSTSPLATIVETAIEDPPIVEPFKAPHPGIPRTESERSGRSAQGSSASITSSESTNNSSEFLIVLLDDKIDKTGRTWHGLERQPSRSSARLNPTRISPWDGPLARANGITYRSPPSRVLSTKIDESSSEEEEWENAPVIPLQAYLTDPLPSNSPSHFQSPVTPMQYLHMSPIGSVASLSHQSPYSNNPYSHSSSPYIPAYTPSNLTPNTPISRSNSYIGYTSPYVPMPILPQN